MSQNKTKSRSGRNIKKKGFQEHLHSFLNFLDAIHLGERTYHWIYLKIINTARVLIASFRKFYLDDGLTKASSITFTAILSLVPALAVALSAYSVFSGMGNQKDMIFRQITLFLKNNGISLNLSPLLSALSELLENASKIGGVSAAVMIFTATATLRSLEKSLNSIWRAKKRRPILLKIAIYWAALTLGPIMLITGITIATRISTQFTATGFTLFFNFIAPFSIIWLLFLLIYIILPNTRVSIRAASAGATFTAALWVSFILAYIVYIKSFARGTFALYGAMAVIPLSLLMLYASSMIILLGAEVSYTLMHPMTYLNLQQSFSKRKEISLYESILILYHIYRRFESGQGRTGLKELAELTSLGNEEIEYFLNIFNNYEIIIEHDDGNFMPATSSANLQVNTIIDAVSDIRFETKAIPARSPLKKILTPVFKKINDSRKKSVGDMTLGDLIDSV